MKRLKKNTIYLLLVALVAAGCSDWLDVAPSNQVNEDEMFSTGDGYRNALNGIYLNLAGSNMYGKELTWGFMDILGQHYKPNLLKSASTYRKAADYKYDDSDVKSLIANIWLSGYNDIANCNNLIRHVSKESPALFTEKEVEKNMIWGEALALRAFIHFDMLRMFAPSMKKDEGKSYIPYVDAYPTIVTTYLTNAQILEKVETDLTQAKDLLATCDTVGARREWMSTPYRMLAEGVQGTLPQELFFAYRGFRMNYYAITALLARVYCWQGRYEEAYKQAKEVTEASYQSGKDSYASCFTFEQSTTLESNLKDYNSLILAFSKPDLAEDYEPFISNSDGQGSLLMLDAETAYEGSKEDTRGETLLGTYKGNKYSRKYTIAKGTKGTDMIPILRLSEMYYIMGEYYARNNDLKKGCAMLDAVRSARGIISKSLSVSSLEEFERELLKEIRKELVGEGQLYFQYKRLDRKPTDKAEFVFDRPDNEDIL